MRKIIFYSIALVITGAISMAIFSQKQNPIPPPRPQKLETTTIKPLLPPPPPAPIKTVPQVPAKPTPPPPPPPAKHED
ncbi:MAG TPA: hypothetical protein VGI82_03355 [Chitinophagaceae bacterium]